MDVKIHYEILYQTGTMWQWTPGIKINKSNKSKVKNPANWLAKSIFWHNPK